ncbi:triose-phosphate isomerase [Garciella nitratireducens]|uniref:Triosephosphate isomerase n=1 Tax=Garciella nitratireducens DSM 15102 TaxID=1121911 RepID=A0A1T4KLI6_9FIRM|nr:triose-phosphate isomerase [Garciella nitratireducens]RBP41607.1 triosephosphate isomerase [Garciella nitratireducens]SJZ43237.1 triosephosphate isomerase [Garciella nitratireducens DSM 15102]
MRKPIIAGNWKMNNTIEQSKRLVKELIPLIKDAKVDVVLCPSYLSLQEVKNLVKDTSVKVGAQNMHFEKSGAYTGEVSGEMLKELEIEYVIIGHSERRQYFNETDETVNRKVKKALELNLIPIICVGETLEEREQGKARSIVTSQVEAALKDLSNKEIAQLVIAYEPIWAIGTGKTASSQDANEVCSWIRDKVNQLADVHVAQNIRIQYGGSVKPNNIKELMEQPHIDGALVGGASLKVDQFSAIVNY